ncbi:MAG: DNA-binding protein [Thermodesulfovibrio sp. RBG_19FT_COMBO_42_12]|jgi:predicted DNA-binding protein with PD1-like motif|nr:MAG: DNA-binding protein [Thermodesulfovibrio sp. RBG_19FT_COMBO_42_12]OHE58188.1 MAG: DNA-binding protein [Thermodesulfovibrio sp. RBG_19FT_COMBO_42_12]
MKYQIGKTGRVVVARFEDKEDVLKNIADIAKKENIRSAVFYLIGGLRQGRVVVGPEKEELPPKPVWKDIKESHEVLGIGTIFWQEDDPKIHFHGAFGKKDMIKVGCLRETSETFLVIEAIIIEIEGVTARRELDQASGLTLLKL